MLPPDWHAAPQMPYKMTMPNVGEMFATAH
jgi:hypothetical protein